MVVLVVNITDAPGSSPSQVDVYNKTLDPGGQVRIPAELVNAKLRNLEAQGLIAIGSLPPWYEAAKKRKGRVLTAEEMAKRIVIPAPPPLRIGLKELPKEIKDETEASEESIVRKRKG